MMRTTMGLDIAKNAFHLGEMNSVGGVLGGRKLRRRAVPSFFGRRAASVVAMETCSAGQW